MSRSLKEEAIVDLLARLENVNISEGKEDTGDLNYIYYYPDLQDLINELEDNNDDEVDNEIHFSTMGEGPTDPFYNPASGPSNRQAQSCLLGVAAWRQRSRYIVSKYISYMKKG